MKNALGGFAGNVLRDALRTPPRFSRSGPGRKAPRVQPNAGLFAEAGGKRPSGKARESAWNRASRGSARWAGSNSRRRHSCRRRVELRDERCPGRSGRGEAPPRATADGERRRRRPRSPQKCRSLTREHPGFDSRRTVRRAGRDVPGGRSAGASSGEVLARSHSPLQGSAAPAGHPAGHGVRAVRGRARGTCWLQRSTSGVRPKAPGSDELSEADRSGRSPAGLRKSAENRTGTAKSRDRE